MSARFMDEKMDIPGKWYYLVKHESQSLKSDASACARHLNT